MVGLLLAARPIVLKEVSPISTIGNTISPPSCKACAASRVQNGPV